MNLILANLGYPSTNSDAAKTFASYGRRISKPEVGAIAVLTRGKRGGRRRGQRYRRQRQSP